MSAQWHNPNSLLSPGEWGWRFLTSEEAKEIPREGDEFWSISDQAWKPTRNHQHGEPCSESHTYRTKRAGYSTSLGNGQPLLPPPPFASSEELNAVKLVVEALRGLTYKRRCAVVAAARALLEEEGA